MKRHITTLAIFAATFMLCTNAVAINDVVTYPYMGTHTSASGTRYGYVYINDNADVKPTRIYLERYADAGTGKAIDAILLTDNMKVGPYYVVQVGNEANAFRTRLEYDTTSSSTNDAGETTQTTTTATKYGYYSDNGLDYVYGSDLPASSYVTTLSYGAKYLDIGYGNTTMNIGGTVYYKGFGVHATAKLKFNVTAGLYNRFMCMCGVQYTQPGVVNYQLTINTTVMDTRNDINKSNGFLWDYPLDSDVTSVTIDINQGANNGNDHCSMGGLRFYMSTNDLRLPQTISCTDSRTVFAFKETKVALDAKASSGLPVYYRMISGSDIASFDGNGNIVFNKATTSGTVVVEAYQPGSNGWAMAPIRTMTYNVVNGAVVKPGETLQLNDGDVIDEIVVYNDGVSSGNVQTKGLPQVGKLTYKYTFVPGRKTLISFPGDMDIEKISNISDLGYKFNAPEGEKGYTLKEYSTRYRALGEYGEATPEGSDTDSETDMHTATSRAALRGIVADEAAKDEAWHTVISTHLTGKRGYMITFTNPDSSEPFEVTFTLKNTTLEVNNGFEDISLNLDLSNLSKATTKTVYVAPKNVAGNTLKVEVHYEPQSESQLPFNYRDALANARITYTANRDGIRLTLPTSTPARLVIYDASGKRMVKAVNYISPFLIDVADFAPGDYKMYIAYGNARAVKTFSLPPKQ